MPTPGKTATQITATWSQVAALRLERQHVIHRLPAGRLLDVVRGARRNPGPGHEPRRTPAERAHRRPAPRRHPRCPVDEAQPREDVGHARDASSHCLRRSRLVRSGGADPPGGDHRRLAEVLRSDEGRARDDLLVERFLRLFPGADMPGIGRWWGSRDTMRKAIDASGLDLVKIDVEGTAGLAFRSDTEVLATTEPFVGVRLLPGFDAYDNDLPRRVDALMPVDRHDAVHRVAGWVSPVVIVDGRVAGTWELPSGKRGGITVQPFGRWRGGARKELEVEVERIAAFLDRPLAVSISSRLPTAG